MFECQEFVENAQRSLYMVVSESAFLLLAPEEKRKNFCVLTQWAGLTSLAKLERDLDTPNKILFFWHIKGKRVCLLKGAHDKKNG